jgi:hypothetical protein
VLCKPPPLHATDIVKAATAMGNADIGHIEQWVNHKIINENEAKFILYIIEPKPNSPKKAIEVLTVAMEQDKFKIEQIIFSSC